VSWRRGGITDARSALIRCPRPFHRPCLPGPRSLSPDLHPVVRHRPHSKILLVAFSSSFRSSSRPKARRSRHPSADLVVAGRLAVRGPMIMWRVILRRAIAIFRRPSASRFRRADHRCSRPEMVGAAAAWGATLCMRSASSKARRIRLYRDMLASALCSTRRCLRWRPLPSLGGIQLIRPALLSKGPHNLIEETSAHASKKVQRTSSAARRQRPHAYHHVVVTTGQSSPSSPVKLARAATAQSWSKDMRAQIKRSAKIQDSRLESVGASLPTL